MYIISSLKKNIRAISKTNNDIEFHNNLFDTDDCIITWEDDLTDDDIQLQLQTDAQIDIKKREIQQLKNYLLSSDYKIIRQLEQSIMISEEYQTLLIDRQNARNRINEIEATL
jgi:uncharacterized protein YutE (UPF0331/DUF86 family)